jgi:hypothetical protein
MKNACNHAVGSQNPPANNQARNTNQIFSCGQRVRRNMQLMLWPLFLTVHILPC